MLPGSKLIPYAPDRVDDAYEGVLNTLRMFSDRMEPHREGNAVFIHLDLGRLKPDAGFRLGGKIRRKVKREIGIPSVVGMARGKFAAYVAALHTDDVRLISPAVETAALASYPVTLLPLEKEALRRLDLFGIHTIGEFGKLPRYAVLAQFGKAALLAHDLARGKDEQLLNLHIPKRKESAHCLLDDAVTDQHRLEQVLYREAAKLFLLIANDGFVTDRLTIELHTEDGENITVQRQPHQPVSNHQQLQRLIAATVENMVVDSGIMEFHIALNAAQPPKPIQLSLFPDDDLSDHNLSLLETHIVERHGAKVVRRVKRVHPDNPLPERRVEHVS